MFEENSGSEQERENEILKMVDRIVEESEKADETVVNVSSSHFMTQLHQNLAMSNEILTKTNSIEKSQTRNDVKHWRAALTRIVNPVVSLTPPPPFPRCPQTTWSVVNHVYLRHTRTTANGVVSRM